MKKRIVISGGGTGGHVFPAIAVAEILATNPDYSFAWIGSRTGIEYKIVKSHHIDFFHIPSGKLRRYASLQNISDVFKIIAGFFRALSILRSLKPHIVFSKGGFVSVPPVLAARLLGIPVVSHESDFDPGLATRINAVSSKVICVPWAETKQFFRLYLQRRVHVSGNPIRKDVFNGSRVRGLQLLGFSGTRPVLFVQGGSLGAVQINDLVRKCFNSIIENFDLVHQRGEHSVSHPDIPGRYYSRTFFSEEYAHILHASDLVLSRAGAGSLWEMGVLRKPGILLPLASGSRGDQLRNACHVAKQGACIVLDQDRAVDQLEDLLRNAKKSDGGLFERLPTMANAWEKLVNPDGATRIADIIRHILSNTKKSKG